MIIYNLIDCVFSKSEELVVVKQSLPQNTISALGPWTFKGMSQNGLTTETLEVFTFLNCNEEPELKTDEEILSTIVDNRENLVNVGILK